MDNDLLSSLPDDLLGHILAFLTTKEAALTSVLSKRWRNLIAFVPNVDLEDYVFLYQEEAIRHRFMDFVDRVLALQGSSPIKKFSLNCIGVDSVRVDAWISNVLARGVSELDLLIVVKRGCLDKYRLSPKCFENKKLVKLEIRIGTDIGWLDGSVCLPMLKTLVLSSVSLSVDTFEFLLHALPALEELVLKYIKWDNGNVSVSSASLKTLTINPSGHIETFSLDAPSLVYFYFSDYVVADDYSVSELENLFEARIDLWITEGEIKQARHQVMIGSNLQMRGSS